MGDRQQLELLTVIIPIREVMSTTEAHQLVQAGQVYTGKVRD